jgi:ABC-type transport system involved in cytochrome bd biosynthesis fused ATPase/permease subunit
MSRDEFSKFLAQVVMAILGLSHTYNTKVGNDFVRGVSGGERKRVSVAEMLLAGAPFAAWDNSTRGLDSATALKFVQVLGLPPTTRILVICMLADHLIVAKNWMRPWWRRCRCRHIPGKPECIRFI